MPNFTDSLRGYAYKIHKRDHFKCQYCGADGSQSFATWLTLSWDHLLPKEHPKRNDSEYIVTACNFCNAADNHYFLKAEKYGLVFEEMTREQLVEQRKKYVETVRQNYRDFWEISVKNTTESPEM